MAAESRASTPRNSADTSRRSSYASNARKTSLFPMAWPRRWPWAHYASSIRSTIFRTSVKVLIKDLIAIDQLLAGPCTGQCANVGRFKTTVGVREEDHIHDL
ncbi:Uncharacterized protein HZ326_27006 [Fusarium oxysporum f. sp. albedinis]|nr:Uncharacterized protein HZ326_27006 [Fusarium oxysporum f. sp. albedinis]